MKIKYFLILFLGYASCTSTSENGLRIQVDAGDFDRNNSLISFPAPDTLAHENYQIIDSRNNKIPVQIENKIISFFLPQLNAGEKISYRMVPSKKQNKNEVSFNLLQDAVAFYIGDNSQVLQYRSGVGGLDLGDLEKRHYRGGYIHPVISPKGEVITQHYNPDRPHQNGIWSGWSGTDFDGRNPGFWSGHSGTGSVEVYSLDKIWSGTVHGGIIAKHHFIDKTTDEDISVLSETWTVKVHNINQKNNMPVHVFDLEAEQLNISRHPLTIREHVYGGIGFRGNDTWLGEENTRLLTSEGKTKLDGEPLREIWAGTTAHQSRARWAYLSGVVDGEHPGIAILVHPENLHFPEPIFMNLREPFFMFSPAVMGNITIEPGTSIRFRYRYIVFDDEPDPEYLENLWQDYAHPVHVTLF